MENSAYHEEKKIESNIRQKLLQNITPSELDCLSQLSEYSIELFDDVKCCQNWLERIYQDLKTFPSANMGHALKKIDRNVQVLLNLVDPPLGSKTEFQELAYIPQRFMGVRSFKGQIPNVYMGLRTHGIATCVGMAVWIKTPDMTIGALGHFDLESQYKPDRNMDYHACIHELKQTLWPMLPKEIPKMTLRIMLCYNDESSSKTLRDFLEQAFNEQYPGQFIDIRAIDPKRDGIVLKLETGQLFTYIEETEYISDQVINARVLHHLEKEDLNYYFMKKNGTLLQLQLNNEQYNIENDNELITFVRECDQRFMANTIGSEQYSPHKL